MNWDEHDCVVEGMVAVRYPHALPCDYGFSKSGFMCSGRGNNKAAKWAPCHGHTRKPMPVCEACWKSQWESQCFNDNIEQDALHAEFLKRGYFSFFQGQIYIQPRGHNRGLG